MENASKALIIAGAILLAILLISLGIMIFTQAQGTIKDAGMSEAQLSAFNKKFTKYEGKQKGSTIRLLVQEVMVNNNSEDALTVAINKANHTVGDSMLPGDPDVTLKYAKGEQPSYSTSFSDNKTYDVSFVYSKGRVAVVIVNK